MKMATRLNGTRRDRVSPELVPDCCITCEEMYIKSGTLACNLDGVDTLPFSKCEYFQRLKMYGRSTQYPILQDQPVDWTLQTR